MQLQIPKHESLKYQSGAYKEFANVMIDANEYSSEELENAYNKRSWLYSKIVARLEFANQILALNRANILGDENILEVAVGPGKAFLELVKRVKKTNVVHGIDISSSMLKITKELLQKNGYSNFALRQADSRELPYEDNVFDIVYNAYMLDLIPLLDMVRILEEFKRVLKPGGRLILLNMSKQNAKKSRREILYEILPAKLVLYIAGGCRPVMMERIVNKTGFQKVTRTFLPGRNASEIIIAHKI